MAPVATPAGITQVRYWTRRHPIGPTRRRTWKLRALRIRRNRFGWDRSRSRTTKPPKTARNTIPNRSRRHRAIESATATFHVGTTCKTTTCARRARMRKHLRGAAARSRAAPDTPRRLRRAGPTERLRRRNMNHYTSPTAADPNDGSAGVLGTINHAPTRRWLGAAGVVRLRASLGRPSRGGEGPGLCGGGGRFRVWAAGASARGGPPVRWVGPGAPPAWSPAPAWRAVACSCDKRVAGIQRAYVSRARSVFRFRLMLGVLSRARRRPVCPLFHRVPTPVTHPP